MQRRHFIGDLALAGAAAAIGDLSEATAATRAPEAEGDVRAPRIPR